MAHEDLEHAYAKGYQTQDDLLAGILRGVCHIRNLLGGTLVAFISAACFCLWKCANLGG